MPEPEILLSICVPTYNRDFLLERNVTFHLQEFRRLGISFELVLVDDCSTDNTAKLLASLSEEPEVSAYRRTKNSGFVSNYAFAMRRARGRYALFLGDDDLLIPEKVIEYVHMLEDDSEIGMIQAPWLMVDGRPGGGDLSTFYKLDAPFRAKRGDYQGLLEFILSRHVFPEFLIVRREILARAISSGTPFIFWAFLYTARALHHSDIVFLPEPFARVTVVSEDPRMHQGNSECMYQWDTYRGGLEYIVSQMWRAGKSGDVDRQSVTAAIMRFMAIRQSVALRLHIQARNWVEAYILYHRMAANGDVELQGMTFEALASLAGTTMAAIEASEFSARPAIVDPALADNIIELLPARLEGRLTREMPAEGETEARAWLRLDPRFGEPIRRGDAAFDIPDYLAQFI
jgi:glycosyltransferase involved in cell wall biosynthesis